MIANDSRNVVLLAVAPNASSIADDYVVKGLHYQNKPIRSFISQLAFFPPPTLCTTLSLLLYVTVKPPVSFAATQSGSAEAPSVKGAAVTEHVRVLTRVRQMNVGACRS
jgi:hypothetical protein